MPKSPVAIMALIRRHIGQTRSRASRKGATHDILAGTKNRRLVIGSWRWTLREKGRPARDQTISIPLAEESSVSQRDTGPVMVYD
jgi:hypothetical protein